MICWVRATEVAGGMVMVQNIMPWSSSGTRPVFVVNMVTPNTTIPKMTVVITAMGLRTSFCTAFLYFVFMASKDVLNDVWKRSSIDIFFS